MEANKELEVLIVEDDLIVSRLHKFSLRGIVENEVQICLNGREAIDYLDEIAPARERVLVLLDLNMPVMNGWDFLEVCHSKPYVDRLVVVVITSSSYGEDHRKALEYERVVAYYTKPLKRENIPQILQHPEVSSYSSSSKGK